MATTQQDTIKDLVDSLTLTSNTGTAAMDEAVKQFGYSDFYALKNSLHHDRYNFHYSSHSGDAISERFLENYCGIRLNNRDTGAMTGLDAGGDREKTTDSIVPETTAAANLTNAQYQSFSKKGLKVNVSYAEEYNVDDFFDAASLLEKEKYIVRNLYSWWVGNALDLIDASLGINFTDGRASTQELDVKFIDDPDGNAPVKLATAIDYGRASKLTLTINMHYYTQLASSDRNGTTTVPGSNASYVHLDRQVLNSLAEAALASNINYFYDLPEVVQKGLVAIVGGMDDRDRKGIIDSAYWYDAFSSLSGTDDGYILMRYLARQNAERTGACSASYNLEQTTMTISGAWNGTWDASRYASTVKLIDASRDTGKTVIKGNGNDNTILAGNGGTEIHGRKGNDVLYGGNKSKDTFCYANGDGKDIVGNYRTDIDNQDAIRITSGKLSGGTVRGNDVVLKVGDGSITVKNAKGRTLSIATGTGKAKAYTYGTSVRNPQAIILELVESLTATRETGTAAMDEAVKQFGYQNFEALKNKLRDDRYNFHYSSHSGDAISERFLENYCGIRLNNRDTGAMTGLDAGGAKEKTTDSILPETTAAANLTNAQYQSFSKKGLKVNVSYAEEYNVNDFFDAARLLEKEKYIVRNLCSWWVGNALDLIDASLGINFTDGRASTKELDVKFIDAPDGNAPVKLATEMDYGRASKLTLTINMHYYTQLASSDRNGTTALPGSDASYAYLDRLVLDSLAEAALASNINYFYDLPEVVQKGLVAIVGGMDDRDRKGIIDSAYWYDAFSSLSGTDDGYILMRYLARQSAGTSLPAGVTVSEDGQTLLVSKDFQGSIDASEYSQSIRSLDASGDGPLQSTKVKAITLKGNGADNIIWGADTRPTNIYGQKGNDILYGGEHKDTFWYANGDGKDTIYNYTPGKDTLRLISGNVSKATVSGKDVVLKIGSGSVRIKNGKGKQIEVIDTNGTSFFQTYTGNRGAGLSYSNAETLKITNPFKGTIDAANASKLKTIDASKATTTVNIKGNKLANTIKASSGGGDLYGQKGNDTLYGGKGKDVFWYANGDGNDTIYNYTAGKDTIHISSGSISKATVSGKDVILKIGSGSMRLKNAKGKNISIIDANGLSYTQPYTASKSVGISYSGAANVKVAKTFTGSTVDASSASKVKTINASAVTKSLTVKGNKLANTIKAGSGGSNIYGQKGNDILYGGKGKDVFWYANGDGKDTIYNYTAGKDKIRLTSGSISKATVSGKDVIFKIGSGSICVKNAKGAKITVTDANGKTTSKVYGNASTSKMLASDSYALEEESTKYVSASSQVLDNVAGIPAAFDSALVASKDSSGSNSTNALSLAASTEIAPESGNSTDLNALSYRS